MHDRKMIPTINIQSCFLPYVSCGKFGPMARCTTVWGMRGGLYVDEKPRELHLKLIDHLGMDLQLKNQKKHHQSVSSVDEKKWLEVRKKIYSPRLNNSPAQHNSHHQQQCPKTHHMNKEPKFVFHLLPAIRVPYPCP